MGNQPPPVVPLLSHAYQYRGVILNVTNKNGFNIPSDPVFCIRSKIKCRDGRVVLTNSRVSLVWIFII